MTSCLSFVNVCSVIAIGLSLARSAHQWLAARRVANRQAGVLESSWWLSTEGKEATVLQNKASSVLEWVDAIKHAKAVVLKALLVTPSMRSVEDLGSAFERLHSSREEAMKANHLLLVSN